MPFSSKPELDVVYDESRNAFEFSLGIPKPQTIQDEMATGIIEVPLDGGARSGLFSRGQRNLVTDEIVHGIGSGQVTVMVGLEQAADPNAGVGSRGTVAYFGSADVFKGTEYEAELPGVTFGTLIYPHKGSFRIGMKLSGGTESSSLRVRWRAFKKLNEGAALAERLGLAALTEAAAGKDD